MKGYNLKALVITLATQTLAVTGAATEVELQDFLQAVQKLLDSREDTTFQSALIATSFVTGITLVFEQNARYALTLCCDSPLTWMFSGAGLARRLWALC